MENNHKPGVLTLTRRIARTGVQLLRNRGELFALEWQEEKVRLTEVLVWTTALLFAALMGMVLFTAVIILLLPDTLRLWATAGFGVIYAGAAFGAWRVLRSKLRREPFAESLEQVRKDAAWLDSTE